jgi:lipoprotein-releasing system permease protein
MFRPLSIFIGIRYTGAKRRNHFISFISMTSMIGLALGVLAMIVVLSVMNGFQKEMSTRILGMVPHASIAGIQPLDDWQQVAAAAKSNPQVIAAVPFAELEGMLSVRGAMQPVQLHGIDPALEPQVSIIDKHMQQGRLSDLREGEFGVVLGEITARRFQLRVGDNLALINVADAAHIQRMQPGQVQSVRLKLQDLYQAPQVAAQIAGGLGAGYTASDWTLTQGSLFSAMKMEKTMIGLLLLLIVAVAAFNIIATLIMVVADKGADIAILRTLGATPGQIMGIFMVQGTVIGAIGTLIGAVLGILAALNVSQLVSWIERLSGQQVMSADVYFINNLPSELLLSDVVLICGAAFTLSFLATVYPSWRAAKIQPADALRYE